MGDECRQKECLSLWRLRRASVLSGARRPAVDGVALRRGAVGEERLRPASRNSAPVRTRERRCSVVDRVSGDI